MTIEPLSIPGAGTTICEIRHGLRARRRLEVKFATLGDPADDPRRSLASAAGLMRYFPLKVRSAMRGLRDCPDASHALVVRGAGRDRSLPATPLDAEIFVQRKTHIGEWVLFVLGSSLGTIVSYREQRGGQLFNNILPVPGSEQEVSSQGSRSLLGLHRECTFSEVGPDFVGLYCHRGGDVATHIVSAARLQHNLTEHQWNILRQPRFVTPPPPLFRRGGVAQSAPLQHSIFLGERENLEIRLDVTLTRGTDAEAEATLAELRRLAEQDEVLEFVTLNPGDVLFLNNRKCLHGRAAFNPRYDGSDRWLVRLYVKTDIWSCRDRLCGDHLLTASR